MRNLLFAIAFLLCLPGLPGQVKNFVTNGDFSRVDPNGMPSGWTASGYCVHPGVEKFDTSGLGTSQAFACNPGGKSSPPPCPPYVLQQNVLVVPGIAFEFSADIAAWFDGGSANSDAGTFEAYLDGVLLDRVAFGRILRKEVKRNRLGARVVPKRGGQVVLKFTFHRRYTTDKNTPRSFIDNVTLRITPDPVFTITGDRKLGGTVTMETMGAPGAAFLIFLSPKLGPAPNGIPIPGILGAWYLDPARFFPIHSGTLDAKTGMDSWNLPVPNLPELHRVPLWFQGFQASGARFSLGLANNLGFHK